MHTHIHTSSSNGDHNHAFNNPERFAKLFDDPKRDDWQKPDEVLRALELTPTATVLEVGAGTGYFTLRLGKALERGTVIALDQSPEMATYLKRRVEASGLANINIREGELKNIDTLQSVDLVFCVDVYHHLHDRVGFAEQLFRELRPHSKVAIIDRPEHGHDSAHAPRVSKDMIKKEMLDAGFQIHHEYDFLLPQQFFLIFTK